MTSRPSACFWASTCRRRKPAAARARLDAALAKSQSNGRLLTLAARVNLQLKDPTTAERLLRRAIEVDSSLKEPYALLGQMYMSQGRADQAINEFEALATRDPASVGAHTFLGSIFQAQNKRAEAKEAYRRALAVDASAPVAANNLAWMYAEDNERLDEALQLAQAAKARLPDSPDVADTLGWIHYKQGLTSSAVSLLKGAIDQEPKNAGYQYRFGLASAKNGDVAAARHALEVALALDPKAAEAAEARAVLEKLGLLGK